MDNVRITYLRDKNKKAFGVLAVRLDRKKNTISYGLSVCHSKQDVYNKTHGVSRAKFRLDNDPMVIPFVRLEKLGAHEISKLVMYDIVLRRSIVSYDTTGRVEITEGLPTRARKYAKAWLRNYNQQIPITVEETIPDSVKAAFDAGFETISRTFDQVRASA